VVFVVLLGRAKVVLDFKIIYILLTSEASNNVRDCICPDSSYFYFASNRNLTPARLDGAQVTTDTPGDSRSDTEGIVVHFRYRIAQ
jgi:hypothetical protein